MKKTRALALLLLVPLLATGCWDQAIIDQMGYTLIYGMEPAPQNNVQATFVMPMISEVEKDKIEIVSAVAANSRDAREKARTESSLSIAGGKVQDMLFSNQLAEMGLQAYLEIFERDPANPSLAYVVIVDGSPKELIEKISNTELRPNSPKYMRQLLDQCIESSKIPQTRIYDFDIDYFAEGIDPIAPLIKLDGDSISVEGAALFINDKMVGRIDTSQNILLEAIMGTMKPAEYTFTDELLAKNQDGSGVSIQKPGLTMMLGKAEPTIDITIENGIPRMDIGINFTGNLTEYMWADVSDKDEEARIETIISNELNQDCNELMDYLQAVGSDPIGFGNLIRVKYNSYWKNIEWRGAYQNAAINVTASITYLRNGTIK